MKRQLTMENANKVVEELFESWDRHCAIILSIADKVGEDEILLKASEDGLPLHEIFCHIHQTRRFFMQKIAPSHVASLEMLYTQNGDEWIACTDMTLIKKQMQLSGAALKEAVLSLIEPGAERNDVYTHPVHYLQHMMWHEAGHYSIVNLALRLAGKDPGEEWEEENVWSIWRTE